MRGFGPLVGLSGVLIRLLARTRGVAEKVGVGVGARHTHMHPHHHALTHALTCCTAMHRSSTHACQVLSGGASVVDFVPPQICVTCPLCMRGASVVARLRLLAAFSWLSAWRTIARTARANGTAVTSALGALSPRIARSRRHPWERRWMGRRQGRCSCVTHGRMDESTRESSRSRARVHPWLPLRLALAAAALCARSHPRRSEESRSRGRGAFPSGGLARCATVPCVCASPGTWRRSRFWGVPPSTASGTPPVSTPRESLSICSFSCRTGSSFAGAFIDCMHMTWGAAATHEVSQGTKAVQQECRVSRVRAPAVAGCRDLGSREQAPAVAGLSRRPDECGGIDRIIS